MVGVSVTKLHLRYQVWFFAQREPFTASHPIVVAHSNQWRLIERMWGEFRRLPAQQLTIDELPQFELNAWATEFKQWFEGWYDDSGNCCWRFKKAHCTLVGPPNAGKTTVARRLLADRRRRVFVPSSNRDFCLSSLNNEDFDVILWDDFDFSSTNRRTLLCLMQGDLCSIDVKCNLAYTIAWRKPIIFTTNFTVQDPAFHARSIIINCDIPINIT